MRRAAGSISSRNGAAWSRGGADHRRRVEVALTARGPAGQFGRIAPTSTDSVRRAIESQVCPWCGRGPYKMLALHVHKAHGVDRHELRRQAGYTAKDSICSPSTSANARDRLASRPDFAETTQRALTASIERGATRIAAAARAANVTAENKSRYDAVLAQWHAGVGVEEIAANTGFNPQSLRRILRRAGVYVDGRSRRSAQMTAVQREKAAAAAKTSMAASAAKLRAERTARYLALGGGWAAVGQLAQEWSVTRKTAADYLRKAGAEVPDGRHDPVKRQKDGK